MSAIAGSETLIQGAPSVLVVVTRAEARPDWRIATWLAAGRGGASSQDAHVPCVIAAGLTGLTRLVAGPARGRVSTARQIALANRVGNYP